VTDPDVQGRGRALGVACLGLAAAAALLWGASAVVWYRGTATGHPGATGGVTDGATAMPSLAGVALLALAGIAAAVATSGLIRRALACLLGFAGAAVAVFAVVDLLAPPAPGVTGAPLLAVAGGAALVGVGVFVLLREPRIARLGTRYAAAGARQTMADPDRAAWVALDEGRDPTVDVDDPGGGRAGGTV
jgi:Tryptophan-associated transmembrane protein (Trp_oprn_chp)